MKKLQFKFLIPVLIFFGSLLSFATSAQAGVDWEKIEKFQKAYEYFDAQLKELEKEGQALFSCANSLVLENSGIMATPKRPDYDPSIPTLSDIFHRDIMRAFESEFKELLQGRVDGNQLLENFTESVQKIVSRQQYTCADKGNVVQEMKRVFSLSVFAYLISFESNTPEKEKPLTLKGFMNPPSDPQPLQVPQAAPQPPEPQPFHRPDREGIDVPADSATHQEASRDGVGASATPLNGTVSGTGCSLQPASDSSAKHLLSAWLLLIPFFARIFKKVRPAR